MQKCDLTGKGKQYGSNVSFSQRHTKKVWSPNLQTKTFMVEEGHYETQHPSHPHPEEKRPPDPCHLYQGLTSAWRLSRIEA
jgi:ribosomal protein L28